MVSPAISYVVVGSLGLLGLLGSVVTKPGQRQDPRLARAQFGGLPVLRVTSSSFAANGEIPARHADYGDKVSPEIAWTGLPASARSIVIVVEDPDAKSPAPFLHWLLFNLPATTTSLPESVAEMPQLPDHGKARQGKNARGTFGYFGPRPPAGSGAHHYHFQVFALDAMLDAKPGAELSEVVTAMKPHVVATGEIVGTFQR